MIAFYCVRVCVLIVGGCFSDRTVFRFDQIIVLTHIYKSQEDQDLMVSIHDVTVKANKLKQTSRESQLFQKL